MRGHGHWDGSIDAADSDLQRRRWKVGAAAPTTQHLDCPFPARLNKGAEVDDQSEVDDDNGNEKHHQEDDEHLLPSAGSVLLILNQFAQFFWITHS